MSDCPRHKHGSHAWTTVSAEIEGRGAARTYVVERCTQCGDLRLDFDVDVVEEVPGDAE